VSSAGVLRVIGALRLLVGVALVAAPEAATAPRLGSEASCRPAVREMRPTAAAARVLAAVAAALVQAWAALRDRG